MFTPERREFMGSFADYSKGYADTLSSEIADLSIVSDNGDRITFSYTLKAKDKAAKGKTLLQTFEGTVEMVKIGNSWKIGNGQSKKISESLQ